MDIEDVRSFERGGGGAYILTGARKAEFYAHLRRQRTSARYLPRLIREIHPTKVCQARFPSAIVLLHFYLMQGRKRARDKR